MAQIINIKNKNEFEEIVLKSNHAVLVDFWATWCGPCQMLAPTLDELAQDLGDKASVVKVDVDANPDLAALYRVRSIPFLVVIKNGQVQAQTVGMQSKKDLLDLLNPHL